MLNFFDFENFRIFEVEINDFIYFFYFNVFFEYILGIYIVRYFVKYREFKDK